jgi:hypothetical protein
VGKELEMKFPRQLRRQLVAESHQLGPYVCVDLLHALVEAFDLEDSEVGWRKTQAGHFFNVPAFR